MSASSTRIRDYYELTKPKVVALIVFTAVVGMSMALLTFPSIMIILMAPAAFQIAGAFGPFLGN